MSVQIVNTYRHLLSAIEYYQYDDKKETQWDENQCPPYDKCNVIAPLMKNKNN